MCQEENNCQQEVLSFKVHDLEKDIYYGNQVEDEYEDKACSNRYLHLFEYSGYIFKSQYEGS